ncbi:hypothetical protein KQH60_10095 [Mycetohabitans sp. B8]|nr:hypothetical protein [Mycetohabitans sp. B8]MCG1042868.1 hypothetical protein [Mycetohabitans sp. B8]
MCTLNAGYRTGAAQRRQPAAYLGNTVDELLDAGADDVVFAPCIFAY